MTTDTEALPPLPERARKRAEWDVLRVTCKGPCWSGVWYVFEKCGNDIGPYLLNKAGNPKRFRSEASARKSADKLNRHSK